MLINIYFLITRFYSCHFTFVTNQKSTICFRLLTDQISLKYFFLFFLFIWGGVFITLSQNSFPKFQLQALKLVGNNFYCIVFLFVSAQKVCLRSKILFQTELNNFCPLLCNFYHTSSKKKSFPSKENTQVSERIFCREDATV